MTPQYEMLIELLHRRMSVRKLKPDPLPEGTIEKILEAGRWAMSGANGQPWEYIVVTDPAVKQRLFNHYKDELNSDYNFWMEQMRVPELRHPAFQLAGDPEEQLRKFKSRSGWAEAPVLIVVLGDGRRQWATAVGNGNGWPYFWPPPIPLY
jgi:nitroreductase